MRPPRMLILGLTAALAAALPLPAGAQPDPPLYNVEHVTTVPGATGGHAVGRGDRLYVGAYGLGMRIFDVSEPANPVQIGEYIPGFQSTSDLGVRADAVPDAAIWDGRHIATLNGTGRAPGTQQTEFLDVTEAGDPVLLHRFTGATHGEAHNGDIAQQRRLWLPSGGGGNNGLRIYDMRPLLGDTPQAPTRLGGWNPHTLWTQSPYRGDKPTGFPFDHTHDVEIYEDFELLLPEDEWVDNTGDGAPDPTYALRDVILLAAASAYALTGPGSNTGAVYVIDITDPTAPVVLSKWHNPFGEDHKEIRYLHEVQFLDGDPSTIIVSDEDLHSGCDAGRLYVLEASPDLLEIEKVAEWAIGTGTPAPVCGSHVFSSQDQYLYMGAYNAGLQILDLRDPANPVRVGQGLIPGMNSWGALAYRDHVYVGDFGARGLDVFRFYAAGPPNPHDTRVRSFAAEVTGDGIAVSGEALLGGQAPVEVGIDPVGDSAGGPGLDIERLLISRYDAARQEVVFTIRLAGDIPVTHGLPEGAQFNWDIAVDGGAEGGGSNWSLKTMRTSQFFGPGRLAPYAATYSCVQTPPTGFSCTPQDDLRAAYDPARQEVSMFVPLGAISAQPGSVIEGWARTSSGPVWVAPSTSGAVTAQRFDAVPGHDEYTVPVATVSLGVAPAGTPEGEVPFGDPAAVGADGLFQATLAAPGDGAHDVWVRACLADNCDSTFRRVETG